MIYLDSSALLMLLFEESESAALAQWISERSTTPMVSSELARVEVVRRRGDGRHRVGPAVLIQPRMT